MKFKDVAHLYLGCELKKDSIIRILTGSFYHHEWLTYEENQRESGLNIEPFRGWKPILRRLEDLTEEHARELVPLIWQNGNTYENIIAKAGKLGYDYVTATPFGALNIGCLSGGSFFVKLGETKLWLKLLSWGYDLFGLIESGEAIDAKTLEVTK